MFFYKSIFISSFFWATLALADPEVCRVPEPYHKTQGSQILLITNNQSTPEEVAAWKTLFEKLELTADTWDTHQEGFLEFSSPLTDSGRTLGEDFKDSTVVMLNNDRTFKPDPIKRVQADAMVPKSDVLLAAAKSGVHFYFVGKDKPYNDWTLSFFLLPSDSNVAPVFENEDALIEDLHQNPNKDETFTGKVGYILLDTSGPKALDRKAASLQQKLVKDFPGRRHFVLHRYSLFTDEHGNPKNSQIEVFQSLPRTRTSWVAHASPNDVLQSPEFILGERNIRGLISALPLHQKIQQYKAWLNGKREIPDFGVWIKNAILVDVLTEQGAYRQTSSWKHGSFVDFIPLDSLQEVIASLAPDFLTFQSEILDFYAEIYLTTNAFHWKWRNALLRSGIDMAIAKRTWNLLHEGLVNYFGPDCTGILAGFSSDAETVTRRKTQKAALSAFESRVKERKTEDWNLQKFMIENVPGNITRDSDLTLHQIDLKMTRDTYEQLMDSKKWVGENQAYFKRIMGLKK